MSVSVSMPFQCAQITFIQMQIMNIKCRTVFVPCDQNKKLASARIIFNKATKNQLSPNNTQGKLKVIHCINSQMCIGSFCNSLIGCYLLEMLKNTSQYS